MQKNWDSTVQVGLYTANLARFVASVLSHQAYVVDKVIYEKKK